MNDLMQYLEVTAKNVSEELVESKRPNLTVLTRSKVC